MAEVTIQTIIYKDTCDCSLVPRVYSFQSLGGREHTDTCRSRKTLEAFIRVVLGPDKPGALGGRMIRVIPPPV